MAASGSTTIQLYNSSTASAVPTSGNLVQGELGINVTDKKIYTKNASAAVVVVGFGPDASVALTALTGLTVSSGGASITGNTSVVGTLTVSSQLIQQATANDTFNSTNAALKSYSTSLGAGLWGQQMLSSPYSYKLQNCDSTFASTFPIEINPLGGNVVLAGGKVTASPTGLAVTGALSATTYAQLGDSYDLRWGDASTFIAGNSATDIIQLAAAGAERARVSSTGLAVTGSVSATTALNVAGNGGLFNAANKFGLDVLTGTTRLYSSGPNSSTRGTYEFHVTDSVGTLDTIAATLDVSLFNVWTPSAVFGNGGGAAGPRGGFYSSSTLSGFGLDSSVPSTGSGFMAGLDYFYIERTASTGSTAIHNNGDLNIGTVSSNPLIFTVNNSEVGRFDNAGNLLVGTTNATVGTAVGGRWVNDGTGAPGSRLELGSSASTNSNIGFDMYSTGAGAYRFSVGYGGTIFATSTSISALSDISLKENIRELETGLSEVMRLKPRRFDWKNGDGANVAGFIAQELEEVLPELVYDYQYNADTTKKSIKMGDILPTLVKAVQELNEKVDKLEAEKVSLLLTLKSVEGIEARLAALEAA